MTRPLPVARARWWASYPALPGKRRLLPRHDANAASTGDGHAPLHGCQATREVERGFGPSVGRRFPKERGRACRVSIKTAT